MPDIKLTTADVSAMKLGTTDVTKVYLGTTEIWPASAGGGTDVIMEPFDDLGAWAVASGTATIVAGRTGTAVAFSQATTVSFTIPALDESDTITVGFAYRATAVTATARSVVELWSDTGTTQHTRLRHDGTTGALILQRATTTIGTSAAGLITPNTWYYIELQMKLHDTTGFGIVHLDETEVINVSPVDTKGSGTKTVFDTVRLALGPASNTNQYDDLYVTTGAGAAFKGDTAIVTPPEFSDTFTYADNASLATASSGAWLDAGGTAVWAVASNEARYKKTGTGFIQRITLTNTNMSSANHWARADLRFTTFTNAQAGVVIRGAVATDGSCIEAMIDGTMFRIRSRTNGTATNLVNAAHSLTAPVTITIRITATGNAIQAHIINGVTLSTTTATHNTNLKAGLLGISQFDGTVFADNFEAGV